MDNPEKKEGDVNESFPVLNQLITALEETELKFEDACRTDNLEQMNILKDYMLKLQKQIAKEVK